MNRTTLHPSGIQLPLLGLGVWSFGGEAEDYWGQQDECDAIEVVAAALDAGLNYFDTAEGYNQGRSEEALGRALAGRRSEAIIGTKISPQNTEPATLRQHCEASLRRLGTDTIDIYMVHWPITEHSTEDAFATLAELRKEGKIRAIGLSNFGPAQMREVFATGVSVEINQLCYNLIARAIEFEILPICRERGIGVLAYMPLMQGLLTGRWHSADEVPQIRRRTRQFSKDRSGTRHGEPGAEAETFALVEGLAKLAEANGVSAANLALGWVAAQPGLVTAIVGTRNVAQLRDSLRAIEQPLSADLVAELERLSRPVKEKMGPNADMWQTGPDKRIR